MNQIVEKKENTEKPKIMEDLRKASYICTIGGGIVRFFPFSFFEDVRPLGEAALEIGLVGLLLFELIPFTWQRRQIIGKTIWKFIQNTSTQPKGTFFREEERTLSLQTIDQEDKRNHVSLHPGPQPGFEPPIPSSSYFSPISFLPYNPKKHSSTQWSAEEGGYLIGNALCLAGITSESNPVEVLSVESGPSLQSVTFRLPTKVQLSQLLKKREDLANHLGMHQGFDVISGNQQSSAAFVIPHRDRAFVYLRDVIENPDFQAFAAKAKLPLVFGKDMVGKPVFLDFAKLPHLLVAGATNSGKSVFINALIGCLLLLRNPQELKLILIDPKMVELAIYSGVPHLLFPPVTDMRRAAMVLAKVVDEMEKRYERFAEKSVRNIEQFNRVAQDKMPYMVVVVDEYADLMMVAGNDVEDAVTRLAQKARAAGIHLLLATQRPSVDVVTGIIKANLPSRVAFRLSSSADTRTVMEGGCPNLMGYGDGIAMINSGQLNRFQSSAVSIDDDEATEFIEKLKEYWRQAKPVIATEAVSMNLEDEETTPPFPPSKLQRAAETIQSRVESYEEQPVKQDPPYHLFHLVEEEGEVENVITDKIYQDALELIFKHNKAHTTLLQHELRISFLLSTKILNRMESEGIVGPANGHGPRSILVSSRQIKPSVIRTDEDLLEEMKYQICLARSARSNQLRDQLGIRKEKILQLMQKLVEEDFLLTPLNSATGYQIAWSDEQIEDYVASRQK